MGKQMEGDNKDRRRKARQAREEGRKPSADAATQGASKQRYHLERDEDHVTKIEAIRRGKQPMLSENTPEPRPGSRRRD